MSPELLPNERVDVVVAHHPDSCLTCGTLLQGDDPEPVWHKVIEIPPIMPLVIEHRLLHRLVCPCCSTITCAERPADVEQSRFGPRLSGQVGSLGNVFPLSSRHTHALLHQLLGVGMICRAIAWVRQRLSAALSQPIAEDGWWVVFGPGIRSPQKHKT